MSEEEETDYSNQPSLPDLIAQLMEDGEFNASGWGSIENAGQAMQKARDTMRDGYKREHQIFKDTFNTDAGRQCLEIMLDQTLRRSAWPAEMNFGMDVLTSLGIFREGQNSMVAAICEALAAANEQEVKPRKET